MAEGCVQNIIHLLTKGISHLVYIYEIKELEICRDVCSHVVLPVARVGLSGAPVPLLTAASCRRRSRQSSVAE
jgi:hypothetical protein